MNGDAETGIVEIPDAPNLAQMPTVEGLPEGYLFRVTRYADLILRDAFSQRWDDLLAVLNAFRVDLVKDVVAGGGSRAPHVIRFDASLHARGWGKRNIRISRLIDGKLLHETRGHEIDMFAPGESGEDYPGIAVEMEWNNKDPFFDRDLLNFQALHREGAIGVGVIVTRGPRLQELVKKSIKTNSESSAKFGSSTTHWDKLMPRINLGGGGECPLLVIGIEPERVDGVQELYDAYRSGRVIRPRDYGL